MQVMCDLDMELSELFEYDLLHSFLRGCMSVATIQMMSYYLHTSHRFVYKESGNPSFFFVFVVLLNITNKK